MPEQHGRGQTKGHQIGKGIVLHAEFAGRVGQPGHLAVQAVHNGGDQNGNAGFLKAALAAQTTMDKKPRNMLQVVIMLGGETPLMRLFLFQTSISSGMVGACSLRAGDHVPRSPIRTKHPDNVSRAEADHEDRWPARQSRRASRQTMRTGQYAIWTMARSGRPRRAGGRRNARCPCLVQSGVDEFARPVADVFHHAQSTGARLTCTLKIFMKMLTQQRLFRPEGIALSSMRMMPSAGLTGPSQGTTRRSEKVH